MEINLPLPRLPLKFELGWYHVPLLLLYIVASFQCFLTAGNPYRAVLAEIEGTCLSNSSFVFCFLQHSFCVN
jgi:hypothetical protein